MKWLLFSTYLMFSTAFFAQSLESVPAPTCSEYFHRADAFSFQRFLSKDGTCFLGADPFEINNFVYRSYLTTNKGIFMVFNSYDPSEDPSSTGARVYYFFPRNNPVPDSVIEADHSVLKTSTLGVEFYLSLDQTRILGMKGGKVKEASKVSPSNDGGVELSNVKTLYLDAGFAIGHDVTTESDKSSRFIDPKGQVCEVMNKEIFRSLSGGNVEFRFSDSQLKTFLKTRCPNISF